jgi:hypothetical protein
VPLDRVRLTSAKSGLRRHRKLRLARPRARTRARPWKTTNSASPDPGIGLGLGPGRRRTPPRPTQGSDSGSAPEDDELRLARPRARTDHVTGGAIITLPLASSGYGEQDRRPIWLAPVKQIMMTPRALRDDGDSQPLTEARRRQQGLDGPDSCPSARLQHSSDGHDITRTGCQNLSGCHDGMYLGH